MQGQKDSSTKSLVVEQADVVGVVLLENLHSGLLLQDAVGASVLLVQVLPLQAFRT